MEFAAFMFYAATLLLACTVSTVATLIALFIYEDYKQFRKK